jgi:hypothetical protein
MANNEHQFESDIEALMTGELGWKKARKLGAAAPSTGQGAAAPSTGQGAAAPSTGQSAAAPSTEQREKALDLATLVRFVKVSQPKEWAFFVKACSGLDPESEFYKKFEDAVATDGMIDVLRNGFYANGKHFSICYFKPENRLNETALANYEKNICEFHRQWHYSASETAKSVDVMLSVNGIPLVAIELKDQFTGQTVENAKVQWMTDRNPKEGAFRLKHSVVESERALLGVAVDDRPQPQGGRVPTQPQSACFLCRRFERGVDDDAACGRRDSFSTFQPRFGWRGRRRWRGQPSMELGATAPSTVQRSEGTHRLSLA